MTRSIKKNLKLRVSKKKYNQKGGKEITLDELKKNNLGYILIYFNLVDKNGNEILNMIKQNEINSIQEQIQSQISTLFETHLFINQNSINIDNETKSLISYWDIQIYFKPDYKEFPFQISLKFISELPLNYLQLDTVTKVITESDFLPLLLTLNDKNHQFRLLYNYSNLGNSTMNYSVIKNEWENEKEIECAFTNGIGSDPISSYRCYTKLDCKKPTRKEQIDKISKKYGRDDIKCIPKYSKFNYDNERIAREMNKTTWKYNVNKLCSTKNHIRCNFERNGCHWDNDTCKVNPADFSKRKNLKYYDHHHQYKYIPSVPTHGVHISTQLPPRLSA
jgi:hypothetical protein